MMEKNVNKRESEREREREREIHSKNVDLEVAFKRNVESNKIVSDFLINNKDNQFLTKDESISIIALNTFILYIVPLVLGKVVYQWLSDNSKISYVKKFGQFNIAHEREREKEREVKKENSIISSVRAVRSLINEMMTHQKQKPLDDLRFVYLILQSTKHVNSSILKLLKSYLTDLQEQLVSKLEDSIDELQVFREQDKIKRMEFLGTMTSEDARAFAQAVRNGIEFYPQFFKDESDRKSKNENHDFDAGDGHGEE